MASIQETELAGIGRRFSIKTHTGDRLIIVMHDTGRVEIYHRPASNPNPSVPVATLDEEEARYVAAIIGKTLYRPEAIERLDRHGVTITWFQVGPSSYATGKTIGELRLTERTRASIIAVVGRDGSKRTNPEKDYVLHEGHQIAISGTLKEVQACADILEKGSI